MSELASKGSAIPLDLVMIVDSIRRRLKKAESVYDVAEEAGITTVTLYAFLNGRVPTIETLQKLCDHFAITIDVATHRTIEPPPVARRG